MVTRAAGSRNRNVVLTPGSDSTKNRPWWASTIVRLIASPMPIPSARVLKYASKTRASRSAGIPSPLSLTPNSTPPGSVIRVQITSVGSDACDCASDSRAFRTRFTRTCWIWTGSPQREGNPGAKSSVTADATPVGLDAEDLHHLVDDEVRVERLAGRPLAGHEPAHSFNDPTRAHRRGQQSLECVPHFLHRRLGRFKRDQAALGVVGDRPERLVELVGQGRRHLPDRAGAPDVAELFEERPVPFPGRLQLAGPLPDPGFQLVASPAPARRPDAGSVPQPGRRMNKPIAAGSPGSSP